MACPLQLLPTSNLELVRKLGQGGQGGVWLAQQQPQPGSGTLPLNLALKTACKKHGLAADDDDASALCWESHVLDALKEAHVPGVLPIHHAALDANSNLYLALHFCDRGDLFSRVKHRGGRLPELESARIVGSLAKTLSCCHALGLMHRDVKLQNVLLATKPVPSSFDPALEVDEEEVFLGDFGLATLLPQPGQPKLSEIVGTPTYVAPEVFEQEYDQRADIWSLGAVLHALLTGYHPPSTCTDSELCQAIVPDELGAEMDSSSIYAHLSVKARLLLVGMLWSNPVRRHTLEQVYDHCNDLVLLHAKVNPNKHLQQQCQGASNKQHINVTSTTQARHQQPTIHCAPPYGHRHCVDYMHNSLVHDDHATTCMLGPSVLVAH